MTGSRGQTSKGEVAQILLTLAQRLGLHLQLALQQAPPQAARQSLVAAKVRQQDPHEQRVQEDPLAVRRLVEVVLARGRLWGRAVLVLAWASACRDFKIGKPAIKLSRRPRHKVPSGYCQLLMR